MLFLSPVFYAPETVPEEFAGLMALNPLSHYIEGFRSCVLGGILPGITSLLLAYLYGIVTFLVGYLFFQRVRSGFADVL